MDVRCYNLNSKIDKLDWFIGGSYDKVLELQKLLNTVNPSNRLLEDGVYGAKTSSAIKDFANIATQIMPYVQELATTFKDSAGNINILSAKISGKSFTYKANLGNLANVLTVVLEVYEAYEVINADVNDDIPGVSNESVKEVVSGISGAFVGISAGTLTAVATPFTAPFTRISASIIVGDTARELTEIATNDIIERIYDLSNYINQFFNN